MKSKKGFTLLELILAVAIFSIIIVATYSILLTGLRLYNKNTASIEEQRSLRMVFMKIDNDVRSYKGNMDDITVTADVLHIGPMSSANRISYSFSSATGDVSRTKSGSSAVIASGISSFEPVIETDSILVTIKGSGDGQSVQSRIKIRKSVDG